MLINDASGDLLVVGRACASLLSVWPATKEGGASPEGFRPGSPRHPGPLTYVRDSARTLTPSPNRALLVFHRLVSVPVSDIYANAYKKPNRYAEHSQFKSQTPFDPSF